MIGICIDLPKLRGAMPNIKQRSPQKSINETQMMPDDLLGSGQGQFNGG